MRYKIKFKTSLVGLPPPPKWYISQRVGIISVGALSNYHQIKHGLKIPSHPGKQVNNIIYFFIHK